MFPQPRRAHSAAVPLEVPTNDPTGQKFGRLTVVAQAATLKQRRRWLCRCDCGAETIVPTMRLTGGNTRSCGCLALEMGAERQRLFDEERVLYGANAATKDPTWCSWRGLVLRCTIGGDVIVDPRWLGPYGYRRFLAEVGERPTSEHQLGRIDPRAPYAKENCLWELRAKGTTA